MPVIGYAQAGNAGYFDDAGFLDRQYTVWGKVTDGMDIVDGIKRGEPVREPDKIARMQVAADAK